MRHLKATLALTLLLPFGCSDVDEPLPPAEEGAEARVEAAEVVDGLGIGVGGKADEPTPYIDVSPGDHLEALEVEGFSSIKDTETLFRAAKVLRVQLEAGETVVIVARHARDTEKEAFDPLIITRTPSESKGPGSVRQSFLPMADAGDAAVVLTAEVSGPHVAFVGGVDFRMGGVFDVDVVSAPEAPVAPWMEFSTGRRIIMEMITEARAELSEDLATGGLVETEEGRLTVGAYDGLSELARLRRTAARHNDLRDEFFSRMAKEIDGLEIDDVAKRLGPVWLSLW